jgi:hypothetical protein
MARVAPPYEPAAGEIAKNAGKQPVFSTITMRISKLTMMNEKTAGFGIERSCTGASSDK